jgi:hypothetical protein
VKIIKLKLFQQINRNRSSARVHNAAIVLLAIKNLYNEDGGMPIRAKELLF